ncbi:MAG: hypothetical protein LUG98_15040 [Tannerellaceae bacterium]|nr:hypothetical protein [Tannerellaceae bacterium]
MYKQKAMNRLYEARQKFHLGATPQSLFYELLRIFSAAKWEKEEITCSTQHLCHALLISDTTLRSARAKLVEAGLITYTPPSKHKQAGRYSLVLVKSRQSVKANSQKEKETVGITEENTGINSPINAEINAEINGHCNYIDIDKSISNNILLKENKKKENKIEENRPPECRAQPSSAYRLETERQEFEKFRLRYPGIKRGLDTEVS